MAIEDFGNCYVNRVGGDVDVLVNAFNQIGPDTIRALVAAASAAGLGAWLDAIPMSALQAFIEVTFGVPVWEALVLLAGAASWAALIDGFTHCLDQL